MYEQLLPYCDTAHITKIDYTYQADAYCPRLDTMADWYCTAESEEQTYFDIEYYFQKYERKKIAGNVDFCALTYNNKKLRSGRRASLCVCCNKSEEEKVKMEKKDLDWSSLGFGYRQTDKRYVTNFKNGAWDEGGLTEDAAIVLNECAGVLQYAQTCFEGLKAYTTQEGKTVVFRPDLNEQRMHDSCVRL